MLATLRKLTGNARGCVYTEPLWGIPYNLFVPYASIYMLSLGLRDTQIGLIAEMLQAVETEPTPLQRRLDELGKILDTQIIVMNKPGAATAQDSILLPPGHHEESPAGARPILRTDGFFRRPARDPRSV